MSQPQKGCDIPCSNITWNAKTNQGLCTGGLCNNVRLSSFCSIENAGDRSYGCSYTCIVKTLVIEMWRPSQLYRRWTEACLSFTCKRNLSLVIEILCSLYCYESSSHKQSNQLTMWETTFRFLLFCESKLIVRNYNIGHSVVLSITHDCRI